MEYIDELLKLKVKLEKINDLEYKILVSKFIPSIIKEYELKRLEIQAYSIQERLEEIEVMVTKEDEKKNKSKTRQLKGNVVLGIRL